MSLKSLVLGFAALFALVPAIASAKSNPARCAQRVRDAGCYLSNNDQHRIMRNVVDCKQVQKNGTRLEVFELDDSGKVVVIDTTNRGTQYCPVTKYSIDYAGIKEMKIISGNIFMLSNAGRVYFMMSNEETYEILNAKGRSYSNVRQIKGDMGGNAIRLIGPGYNNLMTMSDLVQKAWHGKLRRISFVRANTNRSVFRDE